MTTLSLSPIAEEVAIIPPVAEEVPVIPPVDEEVPDNMSVKKKCCRPLLVQTTSGATPDRCAEVYKCVS